MKVIRPCFVLSLVGFLGASAHGAVSQQTADIFNKNNRELDPPPPALSASSEDSDLRYSDGTKRLARKVAMDDPNAASASLNSDDYNSGSSSSGSGTRGTSKAKISSRRQQGFSGDRFLGVGFVGGGPYGVFGTEIDFGIASNWTAGLGLGTGMTYGTWAAHARYFLDQGRWNPLVEIGFAQWNLGKVPRDADDITPGHLAERFFEDKGGNINGPKTVNIIYPAIGLLYQHHTGLAALLEVQYFINSSDFSGALYGSAGVYFYF